MKTWNFGFLQLQQDEKKRIQWKRLGNLSCRTGEEYDRSFFHLRADGKVFSGRDAVCTGIRLTKKELVLTYRIEDFEVLSRWQFDADCRVLRRQDTLRNTGKKSHVLERFFSLFPFDCGCYEGFFQQSQWCGENRGGWEKLETGVRELVPVSGRTTESCTPFFVLREAASARALAFHLIPCGNWCIRIRGISRNGSLPIRLAEFGQDPDAFCVKLKPGAEWVSPAVCVQDLPGREVSCGTALWHRYMLKNLVRPNRPQKIVYNCWLDWYDKLDPARLRKQLKAAKKAGCDTFVVDYGWFEDFKHFLRVGEWTERTEGAFSGNLSAFADEVRSAGLGFGIWVEAEFFHESTPEIQAHPDWFAHARGSVWRLRLERPDAAKYFLNTLEDVIRRYHPVYIKNDMNHSQETDPDGTALAEYTAASVKLFGELRKRHPEIFWESCASGSNRSSADVFDTYDSQFISDNADPEDNLRIAQGAMLRLPPGKIYRWLVLAHAEQATSCTRFGSDLRLLIPEYATWDNFAVHDMDFACLAAINGGITGISGDISGLTDRELAALRKYMLFQKKYAESISRCEGYLLTPPEKREKHHTWAAFQYHDPEEERHFVYVFHNVRFGEAARFFPLHALDPDSAYRVRGLFPETEECVISGRELMENGLEIAFPMNQQGSWRARLLIVEKI